MVEVSIIIVNYNTSQLVHNCIESINKNTKGVTYEIIVVDNNSINDRELEALKTLDSVTYIQSLQNLGFGKANNLGVKNAVGKYLLFLNPDTLFLNNVLHEMISFMEDKNSAGMCGANIFDGEGNPHHSYRMINSLYLCELDYFLRCIISKLVWGKNCEFNHTSCIRRVSFITGADIFIRRSLFQKLNGFDPDFFMYDEDRDLCQRVMESGYSLYNLPSAKIMHLEGKSFKISEARVERQLAGRFIYLKKHYSSAGSFCVNLQYLFFNSLALILYKITCNSKRYKELSMRLKLFIKVYKNGTQKV